MLYVYVRTRRRSVFVGDCGYVKSPPSVTNNLSIEQHARDRFVREYLSTCSNDVVDSSSARARAF